MNTRLMALCFLMSLLLTSCRKEQQQDGYLIFGHFYGMCQGARCIEIYKLTDSQLFEDTRDAYPGSVDFYQAQFSSRSDAYFQQARHLKAAFPMELLQHSNPVIGQPDAGDWGGYYIEFKQGDVRRFWLIDKMQSNVPIQYHSFLDQVTDVIEALP